MTVTENGHAVNRREFLEISSAAGMGLLIGFRLPVRTVFRTEVGPSDLNAWIRIGTDDLVTLIVHESEMGQGVLTSLPMILAEELEADWTKVRSEHAPADSAKYGNQGTGGSSSIRGNYAKLRTVGAAAREMLIRAAADTWSADPADCRAENSTVIHQPSGRRLRYGELAEKAAAVPPPNNPPLKDPKNFRLIGKATKRLDTKAKVAAEAVFGIDVKVPGMLVAQVVHSPVWGGKVMRLDATRAKDIPGVRHIVEIPTGVAVAADHYWAAKQGRDALEITWDEGPHRDLSSAKITELFRNMAGTGTEARNDGDVDRAIARADTTVEAVYEVPYLAHASMEPMNCTADVRADRCDVWAPTQAPTRTQRVAAEITGLPADKVTVHTTFMGGGFGRRSQTDFVQDAVFTSKAIGKPVKVVFTREDDTRAGYYRPAGYNKFVGAVDSDGWPVAWVHHIASPSILESIGRRVEGVDRSSVEGAKNIPYHIANVLVTCAKPDLPVPLHWWRSVGSSQNAYVTECFLDELAMAGGKDPVDLRRRLLSDHPRHRRVLDLAVENAGWGKPLPKGRARGVAVHESFGSFVAQVAEVSLEQDGAVRVHRVVCAVDCGDVVNPSTVVAQMESGIIYGLSAALYGEVAIDRGRAVQGNFNTYRVVRMDEAPAIETHIVTSGDPLGGIGEPGTPPIAPAVCNAILALTGRPVRRLPIGKVTLAGLE